MNFLYFDEGTEERVGRAWREGMVEIYRREDFENPFSNDRAFAINEFQKLEEGDRFSKSSQKRTRPPPHWNIILCSQLKNFFR